MNDVIGYCIVGILVIGFTWGFVLQLQQLRHIRKNKEMFRKKVVYGHYVRCIAYAGFLTAYILNILIAVELVQNVFFTDTYTSLGCFLFLVILLLANLFMIPKKSLRMQKVKL